MDQFYLNFGYYLLEHFSVVKALVFCFMISLVFFVLIPTTFKTYLSWKTAQKSTNLSLAITWGTLSVLVLVTIYPMFLHEVSKISDEIEGIARIVFFAGLFFLNLFYVLPRMIYYHKQVFKKQSAKSFSLMCFFALISFYSLSALFGPTISLAVSLAG